MKKFLNFAAFIIIMGLVGSWECGNCTFREMLQDTGSVLSVLLVLHFSRIVAAYFKHNKKKNVIIS